MRTTARPLDGRRDAAEATADAPETEARDGETGPRPGDTPRSIALSRRRSLGRRVSDWLEARGLGRLVPWAGAAAALLAAIAALA